MIYAYTNISSRLNGVNRRATNQTNNNMKGQKRLKSNPQILSFSKQPKTKGFTLLWKILNTCTKFVNRNLLKVKKRQKKSAIKKLLNKSLFSSEKIIQDWRLSLQFERWH